MPQGMSLNMPPSFNNGVFTRARVKIHYQTCKGMEGRRAGHWTNEGILNFELFLITHVVLCFHDYKTFAMLQNPLIGVVDV